MVRTAMVGGRAELLATLLMVATGEYVGTYPSDLLAKAEEVLEAAAFSVVPENVHHERVLNQIKGAAAALAHVMEG